MRRILISIIILIVLAIGVSAEFTLNQYPLPFVTNNQFYGVIVIGDNSAAGDTIGAIEIATSLQFLVSEKIDTPVKLASEMESIKNQNAIVVGGPCANPASAELLDYPKDCMKGFWGASVIQLFEHNGFVQILVAGGVGLDTRRAARILSSYETNQGILNGTRTEVRAVKGSTSSINAGIIE